MAMTASEGGLGGTCVRCSVSRLPLSLCLWLWSGLGRKQALKRGWGAVRKGRCVEPNSAPHCPPSARQPPLLFLPYRKKFASCARC